MLRMTKWCFIFSLISLVLITGCKDYEPISRNGYEVVDEAALLEIPIEGDVSSRYAEVSGMAWYNDYLVLLPQFPNKFESHLDGALFKIHKSEIDSFLTSANKSLLKFSKVDVKFNGLDPDLLSRGSGFESIAFFGDDVFFTIERGGFFDTYAYVAKGKVVGDLESIEILPNLMKKINSQTDINNLSEETIIVNGEKIFTVYEANGKNINSTPVIHSFDFELNELSQGVVDNIEYRITDATEVDSNGNVWMINYMWEEDNNDLMPAEDVEFAKFGVGKTHQKSQAVERILEFKIVENNIQRTNTPPINLMLDEIDLSRNWEGIVRYKNGFLIITDKHPETILAYVKK